MQTHAALAAFIIHFLLYTCCIYIHCCSRGETGINVIKFKIVESPVYPRIWERLVFRKESMGKAEHLKQYSKLILQKIWYHWSSSLMVGILQYILIDG